MRNLIRVTCVQCVKIAFLLTIISHQYSQNYVVMGSSSSDFILDDIVAGNFTGDVIYVPQNYTTIQEAVDAAKVGDIIMVEPGTYYERVVVWKPNIKILGQGANSTIVDGNGGRVGFQIEANNVVVSGFTVTNCGTGIQLYNALNSSVSRNRVTNAKFGMRLSFSSNCSIYENNVTGSEFGILLSFSSNNILRSNVMRGNGYNFGVSGSSLKYFVQRIDDSNTVNGKPIYYIVNTENMVVDPRSYPDPGYLAIVNSSTITVKDLTISHNLQGILFAYTSKSTIENVTVRNNKIGVSLYHSLNCTISDNILLYNMFQGILLTGSSQIVVYGNNLTSNTEGIYVTYSDSCIVHGNTINKNEVGLKLDYAVNNTFFHNNIMDNAKQVRIKYSSNNLFDNGFEGNYWSNYTFYDLNRDGIGDIWHHIDDNNTDYHPLMGVHHNFDTSIGLELNIVTNSIIEDFDYFELNNTIIMRVSKMTENQISGFCRVGDIEGMISPPYIVVIDDELSSFFYGNYSSYVNSTHRWVYFAYPHLTYRERAIEVFFVFDNATAIRRISFNVNHSNEVSLRGGKIRISVNNDNITNGTINDDGNVIVELIFQKVNQTLYSSDYKAIIDHNISDFSRLYSEIDFNMTTMQPFIMEPKVQHYLKIISEYSETEGEGWYDSMSQASFSVQDKRVRSKVFKGWTDHKGWTDTAQFADVNISEPMRIEAQWADEMEPARAWGTAILLIVVILVILAFALVTFFSKTKDTEDQGPNRNSKKVSRKDEGQLEG